MRIEIKNIILVVSKAFLSGALYDLWKRTNLASTQIVAVLRIWSARNAPPLLQVVPTTQTLEYLSFSNKKGLAFSYLNFFIGLLIFIDSYWDVLYYAL